MRKLSTRHSPYWASGEQSGEETAAVHFCFHRVTTFIRVYGSFLIIGVSHIQTICKGLEWDYGDSEQNHVPSSKPELLDLVIQLPTSNGMAISVDIFNCHNWEGVHKKFLVLKCQKHY